MFLAHCHGMVVTLAATLSVAALDARADEGSPASADDAIRMASDRDRPFRLDLAHGYAYGDSGSMDFVGPDVDPDEAGGAGTGPGAGEETDAPDDIWTRDKLTGDWGGLRTDLEEHGVRLDFQLIQTYQGVASGGANTNFEYGGHVNYLLQIDGDKLFSLKGFFVTVRARTQFGHQINPDAGGVSIPNTLGLYPLPNQHKTGITGLLVMQALSKNFLLAGGKIDVLDFWTMIYPRMGGGIDGFSNINLLASTLPWLRYVNLSVMGGGAMWLRDDGQVNGGVLVFDLNNSTTTVGIDDMFNDGAGILGFWRFFFDIDDKPARLAVAAAGATRSYATTDDTDYGLFDRVGGGRNRGLLDFEINKTSGPMTFGFYYDHVVWQHPDHPERDLWFFTGWAVTNGQPNFAEFGGFASLEARGLLFGREKDRAGIGGYFSKLTSSFREGLDFNHIWGAELYYNAEITPWFHLTGNLQVTQSQVEDDDPALILGMRAVVDL